MSRFYFHSEDGSLFEDKIGTELPDLPAAQHEAVRLLAELLRADPQMFLKTDAFRMIIQDEAMNTLYVIDMAGTAALPSGPVT